MARTRRLDDDLWDIIKTVIRSIDDQKSIDPAKIADIVFDRCSPAQRQRSAIMHLRQETRAVLRHLHKRKKNGGTANLSIKDERQHSFAGEDFSLLQERYPMSHLNAEGERGYVLRDAMSPEDWLWNLDQLERDGGIKLQHAHQLERWGHQVKGWDRYSGDKATA